MNETVQALTNAEVLKALLAHMEQRATGYNKGVDNVSDEIHNIRVGHRDELNYLLRYTQTLQNNGRTY